MKVQDLVREIKKSFRCGCELASLSEPLEIKVKCRACGNLLVLVPKSEVKPMEVINFPSPLKEDKIVKKKRKAKK